MSKLEITDRGGPDQSVVLNGEDISAQITGYTLRGEAGVPPILELHTTHIETTAHGDGGVKVLVGGVELRQEDVEMLREIACCPSHRSGCADLAERLESIIPVAVHEGTGSGSV